MGLRIMKMIFTLFGMDTNKKPLYNRGFNTIPTQ